MKKILSQKKKFQKKISWKNDKITFLQLLFFSDFRTFGERKLNFLCPEDFDSIQTFKSMYLINQNRYGDEKNTVGKLIKFSFGYNSFWEDWLKNFLLYIN